MRVDPESSVHQQWDVAEIRASTGPRRVDNEVEMQLIRDHYRRRIQSISTFGDMDVFHMQPLLLGYAKIVSAIVGYGGIVG